MDDPTRIQSQSGGEGVVPEALSNELSRLYVPGEPIAVPPEVDRHIAMLAQRRLSGRMVASAGRAHGLSRAGGVERRRVFPMRLVGISAAAAAVLFVALVAPRFLSTPTPTGGGIAQGPSKAGAVALFGDVDIDGRVDIVDALLLSKLAAKDPVVIGRLGRARTDLDVNADGTVDQQDAIALRSRIVKLEGGAG